MMKLVLLTTLLTVFLGIQTVFAQTNGSPTNPVPDWVRQNEQKRKEVDKINGRDERGMITNQPSSKNPLEIAKEREKAERAKQEKIKTIAEINETFAPPSEYLKRYAAFLKQKNTGIARMFPDKNCGEGKTVTVEELERCAYTPQVTGAGSLYSLKLTRIPANLSLGLILYYIGQSEIHFAGNSLLVGSSMTQAAITNVGEIDIDKIDAENENVKFLSELKTVKNKTDFQAQRKTLKKGISHNGYVYSTSAITELNKTYVMRSVAYRNFDYSAKTFWNKDILAVFQVVGQEPDGTLIMLWKIIKEKDSPILGNR